MVILTAADQFGASGWCLGPIFSTPAVCTSPVLVSGWITISPRALSPMHVSIYVGKAVPFGSSLPPQSSSFFEGLSILWVKAFSLLLDNHLNFSGGQFQLSGKKGNNGTNMKNYLAVCTDAWSKAPHPKSLQWGVGWTWSPEGILTGNLE